MIFEKASASDIPSICRIYDDIHTAEESGSIFVGWRRGIYPTDKTVLDSFNRGDLFVEKDEDGVIVASAIITSYSCRLSVFLRSWLWQGICRFL